MFLRYAHIDNEMGELAMGKLDTFLASMGNRIETVSGR